MSSRFAVAVPHLPGDPAREASLGRLLARLAEREIEPRVFTERAPNWALGVAVTDYLAESDADWALQIQDDVPLHPKFWGVLDAMLGSNVGEHAGIICLHASHYALREIFLGGGVSWSTTPDGLVGPAWLIRPELLREKQKWQTDALKPRAIERMHEDDLLGVFAMATGRLVFAPVVTPTDHDLSLESGYGNAQHRARRPAVTLWDAEQRDPHKRDWTKVESWAGEVVHLGRFYSGLCEWLPRLLRDEAYGNALAEKLRMDLTPERYSRWWRPL